MSKINYPVSMPDVLGKERDYLNNCIDTGWVSSQGNYVKETEEAFAKYMGRDYCTASSSGTTALTLALAALRIGPGDEVIVPEFTMIASAWAVSYLGATPVFVDCGPDLNIDVDKIEEKITSHTKVIMPVHVYGRLCDMERVMEIAKDYNVWVVEDACEAHGAKPSVEGHIQCYSLFANKIISSGEGGLITTNLDWWDWQIKHLRGMGFNDAHTFYHPKQAFNYRMSNMQAAVAKAQIERIDYFLKGRERICKRYDKHLKKYTLNRPKGSVLWMYDLLVPEGKRDKLMKYLERKGIETRMFFKPMSMQGMYRGDYKKTLAYEVSKRGLYLPTYTQLTDVDIDYIAQEVLTFLNL